MNQQSTSPTSKAVVVTDENLMTFPEAIARVIDDQKVTKKEWNDEQYYGKLEDGTLMLHKPDGKFYSWIISDGDLEGLDWYVLG